MSKGEEIQRTLRTTQGYIAMPAGTRSPDELVQAEAERVAGVKYDAGKPLAGILYEDFPHALSEVIQVATFGATKYSRGNWKHVSEKELRYLDAMHRHLLAHAGGEVVDAKSGHHHLAHAAWCLLAVLETKIA